MAIALALSLSVLDFVIFILESLIAVLDNDGVFRSDFDWLCRETEIKFNL